MPERTFTTPRRHNPIDDLVLAKLRADADPALGLAGDAVFIRRAYLDAAGILPTRAEVEAFVADPRPTSARGWSIALLAAGVRGLLGLQVVRPAARLEPLARPQQRARVLRLDPRQRGGQHAVGPFVYQLTTASGRTDENGAANYFLIHRNPIEIAENYTQAFLGLTLTCARCHNHPMEKWTQTDYYGFANLFARVAMKEDGGASAKGDTATIVSTRRRRHPAPAPGRGDAAAPLDGVPMASHAQEDRRAYVARWLTSPGEHPVCPHGGQPRVGQLLRPRARAPVSTTCAPRTRPATSRCSTR